MVWQFGFALVLGGLLAACQGGSGGAATVTGVAGQPGSDCPVVAIEGNGVATASHAITLELPNLPADSGCDARLWVTVFGFDRLVADVAATPLLEVVAPALAGDALTLYLDDSDFARIAFQAGVNDTLGYYLDINADLDGDGTVCGTDLSQDFDASPIVFYGYADSRVTTSINLKANGDPCP